MPNVGSATLTIVPKMPGFKNTVKEELKKIQAESSGEESGGKYGSGFSKGFSAKQGIIIGAFSAITSKAMSAVSTSMDAAISRFDTMNNFPTVMQNLGYSADSAQASIDKMSERLSNLPTTLDSMVSSTQRLSAITGDLDLATDAALALNDMLVASGSSTAAVAGAQEQFNQMLSKGKPDMQDWKSLVSTMPGQMDQLAKAMLGPEANANALYEALGGGKNDPTISMDQLLDAIIRLDSEGGEGFASFQEQAETAAGGVSTSIANMQNAVTKGIASVMDEIGKENISGFFNDMKAGINGAFGVIRDIVPSVLPVLQNAFNLLKQIGPTLLGGAGAYVAITKIGGAVGEVSGRFDTFTSKVKKGAEEAAKSGKKFSTLRGIVSGLGGEFNAAMFGVQALTVAITAGVAIYQEYQRKAENVQKATTGLTDAVSRASALDDYAGKISAIGEKSASSAKSLDELSESTASHVDKINEINAAAEEQIGALNSAQSIIQQYAGQTDLSAEAQGKLEYALKTVNDAFGTQISSADVAAGYYTDQEGAVHDLVSSIDELINKKKQEIQMDALSEGLGEAYKIQADAAATYAREINNAKTMTAEFDQQRREGKISGEDYDANIKRINDDLNTAKAEYDSANSAVDSFNEKLGDAARSTSDAADAYDNWAGTMGGVFASLLEESGTSIGAMKDDLRALGADTDALAALQESDLIAIADAYDGTSASIIGVLDELGINMSNLSDETRNNMESMKEAFSSLGENVTSTMQDAGVDMDEFALKLSDAGVQTDTLAALGSDNFLRLAEACGYNIDTMVSAIQGYNGTPILDKDGNIQVNEASLIDAEGRVYNWNASGGLIDKEGNAVVDTVELVDAYGNVVEWNGEELKSKQATANVSGNMAEAINTRNDWNNGSLFDKRAQAYVDIYITEHKSTVTENAAGGYRLHADGGIRYHADGFIATKATVLPPVDVVGEAGAEAIVPLTNRTYAQPFIDMLVDGITKAGLGGKNVNQTFNVRSDNPDLVAAKAMTRMRRAIA